MSEAIEGEVVGPATTDNPTKHPEATVKKLEAAFNNMFNITEAVQYAGIHRDTYYAWLADDDVFSFRMSVAQQAPGMKAKENIMRGLQEGDTGVSKWYLERKDPEFRAKGELEIGPGQAKTEEKLKEFMDDTDDGAYTDAAATDVERIESPTASQPESGTEVAPSPSDIS